MSAEQEDSSTYTVLDDPYMYYINNGYAYVGRGGTGTTLTNSAPQVENLIIPKYITYSDGNIYEVKGVARHALSNYTILQNLVFEGSIDIIELNAFSGCSNLKTVTFNGGNIVIEQNVFSGCYELREFKGSEYIKSMQDGNLNSYYMNVLYLPNATFIGSGSAESGGPGLRLIYAPNANLYLGKISGLQVLNSKGVSYSANAYYHLGNTETNNIIEYRPAPSETVAEVINVQPFCKDIFLHSGITSFYNFDPYYKYIAYDSIIWCETQEVADLLIPGTHYDSSKTQVIVDPSKFTEEYIVNRFKQQAREYGYEL